MLPSIKACWPCQGVGRSHAGTAPPPERRPPSQGEPWRARQALDWPLDPPRKDVLAQAIARFNGLRAALMEDSPPSYTAIARRIRPTPRGHQFTATPLTLASARWGVIVRVTQHVAHCSRPLRPPPGRALVVPPVRHRQCRGQGAPNGPDRHGQVPRPARPPAMPPRPTPARLGLDRRRRDHPVVAMFVVPHAAAGGQRRTGNGDRTAMHRPRVQQRHRVPSPVPAHAGHARRPRGQAACPRATGRQAALFAQAGPQPCRDGIVWVEKGQHGLGGREPTRQHDDQRLHDQALSRSFGAAPQSSRRCRRPGEPVHEPNHADQETRLASHLRTSGVSKCGHGDTTGSAVRWPGLARLFGCMTRPQLFKPRIAVSGQCSVHWASAES
jgi:hypothetical protein